MLADERSGRPSSSRRSVGSRQPLSDLGNKQHGMESSASGPRETSEQDAVLRAKQTALDLRSSLASGSHIHAQSSLQSQLLRRSAKLRRFSSPNRGGRDDAAGTSIEPDWEAMRLNPQALAEEEKALGDYFRRLKMIQLEQETRSIFVHDTNDETQTIYTASDVRQLESEVRELKAQLKARKQKVRQLRAEIEESAQGLELFEQLQTDVKECAEAIKEIEDLELELARLEAVHGIKGDPRNGREDEEGVIEVPRAGTFTRDEAEEILNNQLMAMEQLESEQRLMQRQIEAAKKQEASELQALDRLNAERSLAEKGAREAILDTDKQRNHKLEAACRGYTATLQVLQNMLGILSIDASTDCCVRAVYSVRDPKARKFCEEVAINLRFASREGDRLSDYELCTTSGRLLTDDYAPQGTQARQRLDKAVRANDASLLLQEALVCIEAMEVE